MEKCNLCQSSPEILVLYQGENNELGRPVRLCLNCLARENPDAARLIVTYLCRFKGIETIKGVIGFG